MNVTGEIIAVDPVLAPNIGPMGWWSDERHADRIRKLAAERPNDAAYITETARFTWRDYDVASDRVAVALVGLGFARGDR